MDIKKKDNLNFTDELYKLNEEQLKRLYLNELYLIIKNWSSTFNSTYNTYIYQNPDYLSSCNAINSIKSDIYKILGAISTYSFLTEFFNNFSWPGAKKYKNIEKGILLIYEIIYGYNEKELDDYIKRNSYIDIKNYFFNNDKVSINFENWYTQKIDNYFSNHNYRVITNILLKNMSKNNNKIPNITLYMDVYRNDINYEKNTIIKEKRKKTFYTIIIYDINDFILYTGDTSTILDNNLNSKIELRKYIKKNDNMFILLPNNFIKKLIIHNKNDDFI